MGEALSKWVPFSRDRVRRLWYVGEQVGVDLEGMEGEATTVLFSDSYDVVTSVTCFFPSSGQLVVVFPDASGVAACVGLAEELS